MGVLDTRVNRKLEELLRPVAGAELVGRGDVMINGIEYDSRRIKPGMLFVAVTGFKMDGNRFIPEAIKNGAVAVLTESDVETGVTVIAVPEVRKAMADIAAHFYDYPGHKLNITGVTGTNGKSTSVYLVTNILKEAGRKAGMMNSLVYDTGDRRYTAERTTPDSVDLQRLLWEMLDARCTDAVIEVSSHALVLHRVDHTDFKIGLFTNFSRDHLDFHKTMENYLQAKKLFLDKLEDQDKFAVINVDVKEFAAFVKDIRCNLITCSAENDTADVYIRDAGLYPDKSVFKLSSGGEEREISLALPGRYNLSNAVGAAAVGVALGVDFDLIARGLETAEPVPGRFQPVNMNQPFAVIIDYAHTPDAVERLCRSAREITKGRLLILFGCGGDRDRGKRPLMARAASRCSDFAVITSDNPRSEDPLAIINEIKPGMDSENFDVIPDRAEAIENILKLAGADDTVLIAGKGAEDYQEIGTTKYPFEDRVEVVRVLTGLGYGEG